MNLQWKWFLVRWIHHRSERWTPSLSAINYAAQLKFSRRQALCTWHSYLGFIIHWENIWSTKLYAIMVKTRTENLERDLQARKNNGETCFRCLRVFFLLWLDFPWKPHNFILDNPLYPALARFYQNIILIHLVFFIITVWASPSGSLERIFFLWIY